MKGSRSKAVISSVIGTVIESYDLLLYLHLLPILTTLFFVDGKLFSSRMIATITISATLLMRPLGSIYFGAIGDKRGRKKGLFASIVFMAIPTFIIAILPTYDQIYLWAPIILILCRLAQGFSMGGETGGVHTFLVESSKKEFLSTTASLVYASIMLGGVLATIATYCVSIKILNWRLAFLIGAFLGIIGFYIRYKTAETSQFTYCVINKKLLKNPLYDLIKLNKNELLSSFLMSFGAVVPFHLNYVYMVDFLKNVLNVPLSKIAILNISTQALSVVLMPMFGFLSDKMGKRLFMGIALIILVFVSYPLMLYNNTYPSLFCSIIIQVTLSICASMYSGGFFSSVALLFPVNRRYTASGVSVSVGIAVFSFASSLFLWGSYKNNFFLYTFIFVLLFGFLNFVVILNNFKIRRYNSIMLSKRTAV